MQTYKSMDDIKSAAEAQGGLIVASLLELREAMGYGRLGERVLSHIARELENQGLGYYPAHVLEDNPTPRQHEMVRIYIKSSKLGEMVSSVLSPSEHGDELLRERALDENAGMVAEIRTILGVMQ